MENSLFHNVYNPDVLSCIANLSNDEVFTPPELANKIIDMLPQELFENPDTTFLDPCCKSGVFLREIAKRLIKGLEHQIPDLEKRLEHIFSRQLFGIAITELTSLLSRRSVYCSKFPSSPWSAYQFPEDKPQGNIIYQRIKHTWKEGKCMYCGASKSEYDRGSELETHAYQFIHNLDVNKVFNMKFDVIIGNPPYQMSDGGGMKTDSASGSAIPLYHKFVQQAQKLNPKFLCMIIPSRWFSGGRGLDDFREHMLSDNRLVSLVDYSDSRDCFPGVDIAGGVCYFLWNKDYNGPCNVCNFYQGKAVQSLRYLNEFPVFIRHSQAIDVIHKVLSYNEITMNNIVYSSKPFGFRSFESGRKNKQNNDLELLGSKGFTFVKRDEIVTNADLIYKWKVVMSKASAEHAGQTDQEGRKKIVSKVEVLKPSQICTETYLLLSTFNTELEAINLKEYVKTKFFRFLMSTILLTQNIAKDKFQFIPFQDFSKSWTDEELYAKYGLTEEEIAFIESMIRPME